jgi:hypothetical protein
MFSYYLIKVAINQHKVDPETRKNNQIQNEKTRFIVQFVS